MKARPPMSSNSIESSGLNLLLREFRFKRRMQILHANNDAFVISLPKSGRTWHRLMLGHYLTRMLGRDTNSALKLDLLCEAAGIPRIAYSHNGSSFVDKLSPASKAVASPVEWRGKKVLLLVRDVRDVLVSAYFHCRFRDGSFQGSVSEFVRHPFVGIEKALSALNRWHDKRHLAASFDVVSYESMRRDPAATLENALFFAGLEKPDRGLVEEAVKFTTMENLQRLEQSNFFSSEIMQNASGDPRARKVRSGKVGGFREHLSEEDLRFIEEAENRMGNPYRYPDMVSTPS
jgi:hypothetical protein